MDNFVNRLEFLLKHYELSASNFADKIMVQRSSLSHILSGRNKPSLDFIMKIYHAFPELNLHWLLEGKGEYLTESKTKSYNPTPSLFTSEEDEEENKIASPILKKEEKPKIVEEENAYDKTIVSEEKIDIKKICSNKDIEQIVIFYKDGSFSSYLPNPS